MKTFLKYKKARVERALLGFPKESDLGSYKGPEEKVMLGLGTSLDGEVFT